MDWESMNDNEDSDFTVSYCVNDFCKRFHGYSMFAPLSRFGDSGLSCSQPPTFPSARAGRISMSGCELKDGRWNSNMNLFGNSKENGQSHEILVCDHKTMFTGMLFTWKTRLDTRSAHKKTIEIPCTQPPTIQLKCVVDKSIYRFSTSPL